jgi:hypothetical protein
MTLNLLPYLAARLHASRPADTLRADMQINQTLDTSSLQPAIIRGDTRDHDGKRLLTERRWANADSSYSETLMFDTVRKHFAVCVRIDQQHMKSKAYYWMTAAQAVEWTLLRFAGPQTLEAAKPLLEQIDSVREFYPVPTAVAA